MDLPKDQQDGFKKQVNSAKDVLEKLELIIAPVNPYIIPLNQTISILSKFKMFETVDFPVP